MYVAYCSNYVLNAYIQVKKGISVTVSDVLHARLLRGRTVREVEEGRAMEGAAEGPSASCGLNGVQYLAKYALRSNVVLQAMLGKCSYVF